MNAPGEEDQANEITPQSEELALSSDESLPWLESDDYEDDQGVDTARLVGFALLGLIALALLVGGIWWLSNRSSDPEMVADGSTIAAPAGPYKEKPADAGGKEFAGTGNVAPAVGEGETRDGKLARKVTPAPKPSVATRKTTDKIVPVADAAPSAPVVQVGAYSNNAQAEEGWATLNRQTDKLSGVKHRVVQGQADIGTVFRLQAVPGSLDAARSLCSALKAEGVACQVKR